MASASELWESRTGDVSAERQGFGASRRFYVVTDSVDDNPDDVLRDPTKVTGADVYTRAVPFGDAHPTRTGLFSAFYITEQPRISETGYYVRVVYAPPVDFTQPDNPWELNYQPGLVSTIVRHDWLGSPIGPAAYKHYAPPEPRGELYSVRLPNEDGDWETRGLLRVDAGDSEPVRTPAFLTDVERTEPVGSFSMSRTFADIDENDIAFLEQLGNIVNVSTFKGFPRRMVKFIGASVQAGTGTTPDSGASGFVWRVTLVFEWNSLGYRYRAQDLFQHTDGNRYPVRHEDGSIVIREWLLYPEGELNAIELIVNDFAAGSVASRKKSRQPGGQ